MGLATGEFGLESLGQAVERCQQGARHPGSDTRLPTDIVWLKGTVWNTLGLIHMNSGQLDQAVDCYRQDVEICRLLEDRYGIGVSLLNLGEIYQQRGPASWPEAFTCYQQALSILRDFDDHYLEADVLANLAFLHQEMGETDSSARPLCSGDRCHRDAAGWRLGWKMRALAFSLPSLIHMRQCRAALCAGRPHRPGHSIMSSVPGHAPSSIH